MENVNIKEEKFHLRSFLSNDIKLFIEQNLNEYSNVFTTDHIDLLMLIE